MESDFPECEKDLAGVSAVAIAATRCGEQSLAAIVSELDRQKAIRDEQLTDAIKFRRAWTDPGVTFGTWSRGGSAIRKLGGAKAGAALSTSLVVKYTYSLRPLVPLWRYYSEVT